MGRRERNITILDYGFWTFLLLSSMLIVRGAQEFFKGDDFTGDKIETFERPHLNQMVTSEAFGKQVKFREEFTGLKSSTLTVAFEDAMQPANISIQSPYIDYYDDYNPNNHDLEVTKISESALKAQFRVNPRNIECLIKVVVSYDGGISIQNNRECNIN